MAKRVSSVDRDVLEYVKKKMPKRVQKALADAKYELFYGPSGGGGAGWVKSSKIVEDWWDENMRDDLVVDDGGNVTTKHNFDRYLNQLRDERHKEAKQEAIDEDYEEDDIEPYADREAESYADSAIETSTLYEEHDVKKLVLGKDWP